jgi:hypothetical protein
LFFQDGAKVKGSKEERKARKKVEHAKKMREEIGAKGKSKLTEETEMFNKASNVPGARTSVDST